MSATESLSELISDHRALRNVAFNFLGRVGSSLLTFLFIPIFIGILDAESWGIVAFAISLSAIAMVFDFGFGATLNRELARRSVGVEERARRVELLYSLDVPFILFCAVVGTLVFLLAEYIASNWLEYRQLSYAEVLLCVQLASCVVAGQMLSGFYAGGLLGLQRQLEVNVGRLAYNLLLYGGACLILLFVPGSSVVEFFGWQALVVGVYCVGLRLRLYYSLGGRGRNTRVRLQHLRENYRYSVGIAGTTVFVVCLTQLDKLLLSRLLDLEQFGLYMIAVSVTSLQVVMVQPVQMAVFPQLSALYGAGEERAMGEKFLEWARRVALLVFPVGASIILFSGEIAHLWLQDATVAARIGLPMAILAAGSMLNAVNTLPYTVQLAAGWSSLGFYVNLVALVLMIPVLILLTNHYGAPGAAVVWLLLNLAYVTVQLLIMFRHLVPWLKLSWYRDAFLLPCATSLMVLGLFKALSLGLELGLVGAILMLCVGAIIAVLSCWRLQVSIR